MVITRLFFVDVVGDVVDDAMAIGSTMAVSINAFATRFTNGWMDRAREWQNNLYS